MTAATSSSSDATKIPATRIFYDAESLSGGIPSSTAFGPSTIQYMIQQSGEGAAYTGGYPNSNSSAIAVGTGVIGFQAWPANWPLNTEPSINWNLEGHSGYTGGGDVAAVLECPNPVLSTGWGTGNGDYIPDNFNQGVSKVFIVSCLGSHDAATAIGGNATALTYNGVGYTQAAIIAGQYSAFNFEHAYYLSSGSAPLNPIGTNKDAADTLANQIFATTSATFGNVGVNFNDYANGGSARAFKAGSAILQQ